MYTFFVEIYKDFIRMLENFPLTTEKKVRHFWEVSANKGKFFVLRIDRVAAAKLLL